MDDFSKLCQLAEIQELPLPNFITEPKILKAKEINLSVSGVAENSWRYIISKNQSNVIKHAITWSDEKCSFLNIILDLTRNPPEGINFSDWLQQEKCFVVDALIEKEEIKKITQSLTGTTTLLPAWKLGIYATTGYYAGNIEFQPQTSWTNSSEILLQSLKFSKQKR
eukprot:TRINITY_DN119_c0_g1_i1.p1 TRINITY_DN119_c0_g1~~TRINITY_DN119_c0_g1_i1.p1  ORF type:complete len:167 (+),score=21.79 TRINITY_DN119_c0_g1_i1:13-513(+)